MSVGGSIETALRFVRRMPAALLLVLILPTVDAEADTRVCRQLEAQLAAASSGGGSGQAGRYDSAIARQREQMQKARDQARQAGCGSAMTGRMVAFCGEINATLRRMEGNLAELQRTRANLGRSGSRRERARIMAAIDVNRCRAPKRTLPAPVEEKPRDQVVIDGGTGLRIGGLSGRFRTLCVRICDGYYFPVSYAVTQSVFERDQNACTAMCPGANVELHYHRVPGEESEDMISAVTGLPYTEMPAAFLYRRTDAPVPQGCGCGATARGERGFEMFAGDHEQGLVEDEDPAVAAVPEPSASSEADTSRGSFVSPPPPTATKLPEQPPAAQPGLEPTPPAAERGDRDVRVVGPKFLPDLEEAIDLQARDPLPAR